MVAELRSCVEPDARNPWLGRVSFGEWARQPTLTP